MLTRGYWWEGGGGGVAGSQEGLDGRFHGE